MSIELKALIIGLTEDTTPDGAADFLISYDISADALKKVKPNNLGVGGGISGLGSTDNAVLRANGTGGATAQGSLVTIDDNGAIYIPDQQNLWSGGKALIGYNSSAPSVTVNGSGVNTLNLVTHADIQLKADFGDAYATFDHSTTSGQTRMMLYDVDNAQLERVTVGAADSGGSGFKLLRIPN